jgi:hypothetical protein
MLVDVESGRLFRDLRRVLRLSLPELAARLKTRIDVLEALERGDIGALPPWPETVRVITAYTALGRIDPRSVLHMIAERLAVRAGVPKHWGGRGMLALARPKGQRDAGRRFANGAAAMKLASGAFAHSLRGSVAGAREGLQRHGFLLRLLFAIAVPAVVLISLAQTSMLHASVSSLPAPFVKIFGSIRDHFAVQTAPVRDGLRWIEVDDPRSRRGDKLAEPRR